MWLRGKLRLSARVLCDADLVPQVISALLEGFPLKTPLVEQFAPLQGYSTLMPPVTGLTGRVMPNVSVLRSILGRR